MGETSCSIVKGLRCRLEYLKSKRRKLIHIGVFEDIVEKLRTFRLLDRRVLCRPLRRQSLAQPFLEGAQSRAYDMSEVPVAKAHKQLAVFHEAHMVSFGDLIDKKHRGAATRIPTGFVKQFFCHSCARDDDHGSRRDFKLSTRVG